MTDGNTYAISKHFDESEDYDALQEAMAELEQAEARIEGLEGKLARAVDVLLEAVEPYELQQAEADNMMLIDRIEELEAENKTLRSMVADVIADTGDDPEIMAASRAEWAARTFAAKAELAKAVGTLEFYGGWSDRSGGICGFDGGSRARTTLAELKGQDDE